MGKTVDSEFTVEHSEKSDKALPRYSTLPVLIPEYNTDRRRQDVAENEFEHVEVPRKNALQKAFEKCL